MVVPSLSQGSMASSRGSVVTETSRKRREFPRILEKRRHRKNGASATSSNAPSIIRGSEVVSARPPHSPHSKLINGNGSISRNGGLASSQDALQLQKSLSSPAPSGLTSKVVSGGKPPVSPGIPKPPSVNPPRRARSLSRTRSMIARSGSVRSSRSASNRSFTSRSSSITSIEQRQDGPTSSRQTFYVRVCLGYLTGVKVDALKRRKNTSNGIVVGYAALIKSGKRIALSQPLGPVANDGSQKPLKLFWAKPKGGDLLSSTGSKRRLHFSLKLEKEVDRESRAEDDSLNSNVDYNPEVVKIVVGLKCGEEMYPLGIANLVINGRESLEQKVDLALRPMSELSPGELKHQLKSRLGMFGKKQDGISFKNHDQLYRLASNATLRVRMDVKPGAPGENKATIWGDGDDASYITSFSFDTRGTGGSFGHTPGSHQMSTAAGYGGGLPLTPPSNHRSESNDLAQQSGEISSSSKRGTQEKLPLKYIMVDKYYRGEEMSTTSSLTAPAPGFCSWVCLPFCGGESEAPYKSVGALNNSFSFDDELPSWNEMTENQKDHSMSTRSSDESSSTERSETSEESFREELIYERGASKSRSSTSKRTHESIKRNQHGPSRGAAGMSDEAYEDLKDAQATLRRYANKVGVDMEDLLEGVDE